MSKQHPLVLYVGDNKEDIEPNVFYMYTIEEPVEVLAILGMNMPDAVIINQSHPLANDVLRLITTDDWFRYHIIVITQRTSRSSTDITFVQSETDAVEALMQRLHERELRGVEQ